MTNFMTRLIFNFLIRCCNFISWLQKFSQRFTRSRSRSCSRASFGCCCKRWPLGGAAGTWSANDKCV